MQSLYLLRPFSSDPSGGGGIFLPSRKPDALTWPRRRSLGRTRRPGVRSANGGDQDHYAVLGLPRSASTADVKRAYRLLARKYHPDVSRELRAAEVFKNIRSAYEVLSDEVTRAKYDMRLRFPGGLDEAWSERWNNDESDERTRARRWAANLRQQMQYERQSRETSWSDQRGNGNSGYDRGSFFQVVQFAFLTLFFMRIVGCRMTLALCCLTASLDSQLDAGYKMGYIIAWFLGGRGGISLALFIQCTSWLWGKNSSNLVSGVGLAIWVAANLTRLTPLPQGAVLTLLYMSIKLQIDLKL